jgi:hypothetical protein
MLNAWDAQQLKQTYKIAVKELAAAKTMMGPRPRPMTFECHYMMSQHGWSVLQGDFYN